MKIKCKVCEHEFCPTKVDHYIARSEGRTGIAAIGGGCETEIYDAFDCPVCGCQIVTQERKRVYENEGVEVDGKE